MGCRKNQATLTPAERAAFVAAVLALKAAPSLAGTSSRYDDFVQEHVTSMTGGNAWAHRRPAFLPWHREYLRRFELALQAINPSVTLPYWDWTVDNAPTSQIWNADFMGGDGAGPNAIVATGPFAHAGGNWTLTIGPSAELRREFGLDVPALPTPQQTADCLLQTPYDTAPWNDSGSLATFRNRLEGWFGVGSIHNRVHRWVGGSMQPASSPNDPVFWLHHCNIDRLWAQWQRDNPGQPYHPQGSPGDTGPVGHNLNDSMQPWGGTATVASTLNHHLMGFWYDTDPTDVTLVTPSISFGGVPQGLAGAGRTTYRAIVFEVRSCAPVTFEIIAGPTGGFTTTPLGTSVVVPAAHGATPAVGRLWIAYTSTTPGAVANGSVTVAQVGTSMQWMLSISASTIGRPRSAVAVSLDRSGSMSMDAGDGASKRARLGEAVEVFVETMLEGDGLGIIGYDEFVDRHLEITDVGPQPAVAGSGRAQAAAILGGPALDPRGMTGIGASLVQAQDMLNDGQAAAATPYNNLSIVVLTDGIENVPPTIATVLPGITAATYAVGFGLPSGISVASLDALARATGKYLLVTGALTTDQRFRLSKYFLQILAGVSGADIVVDPAGNLVFGPTHRIPFDMTHADYGLDVILTSPLGPAIDFRLEAPDGAIIHPGVASGPGEYVERRAVTYYRLGLPFGGPGVAQQAGRWHALLTLDEKRVRRLLSDDKHLEEWRLDLRDGSVAYNLLAHAYSTLAFDAGCLPGAVRPGETALVTASLTEYGVPVERRAEVWIDLVHPNGAPQRVPMIEAVPGSFSAELRTFMPGLHDLRVRARGVSLHGVRFTREKALTLAAGADERQPPGRGTGQGGDSRIWDLLECILHNANPEILGVKPEQLRECLDRAAKRQQAQWPKEPAARRIEPAARLEALRRLPPPQITRLAEPPPPPFFPHMEHDDTKPMFGLSPEDEAAEQARKATASTPKAAAPPRPEPRPDEAGTPMFGLSPEDQEAEDERRRSESPFGRGRRGRGAPRAKRDEKPE